MGIGAAITSLRGFHVTQFTSINDSQSPVPILIFVLLRTIEVSKISTDW